MGGRPDWPSSGEWWHGPVQVGDYQVTWVPDRVLNRGNPRPEHAVLHRQSPQQSTCLDALILDNPQRCLQRMKLPRGMFWNLNFIRNPNAGHGCVELYCSDPEPPSVRSQWYESRLDWRGKRYLTPVEISISFMSESEVWDQELALRRVFNENCYGVPRIDMQGWIAKGVHDPRTRR